MSSSLGFHSGAAVPAPRRPVEVATPLPAPSLTSRVISVVSMEKIPSPTGVLAVLFYAIYAGLLPMLYFFVDLDYTDNVTRGVVVGMVTLLPAFILLANDLCTWFNMALFMHLATEIDLLVSTITYATESATPEADMIWSWIGAAIVLVHLVPFVFFDHKRLNVFLAAVGVPVNVAIEVFLDTPFVPNAAISAAFFLLVALYVANDESAKKCSIVNQFLYALRTGKGWIAW